MSSGIRVFTTGQRAAGDFGRYLDARIRTSRQTVEQVVKQQAKGLVKHAFKATPPMALRSFAQGFRASRRAIAGGLKKALTIRNEARVLDQIQRTRNVTRRTQLEEILAQLRVSPSTLLRQIQGNQRPDKKYPDSAPQYFATVATRRELQRLLEATIGVTAAGWVTAANMLGVPYPPWIGRWAGTNTGTSNLRSYQNLTVFRAKNNNRHSDSATIQRALNYAYRMQAQAMERNLNRAIEQNVVRSGDVFTR